jgi:hypothetical protein
MMVLYAYEDIYLIWREGTANSYIYSDMLSHAIFTHQAGWSVMDESDDGTNEYLTGNFGMGEGIKCCQL